MSASIRTLGKYQIHEELGHGGFATVYRGHDPDLGIDVALKVLDANYARDPELVERFRTEARVTARLHQPNIAWILNIDQSDSRIFIVMQYIAGRNLRDWLKTEGLLPLDRITAIIQQVGEALDYAHAEHIVHRDVKPSNILVDDSGHATLTDFGIVKAFEATSIQTTSGAVLGTPSYSSPEQVESKPLDARSDLYSLGVVAYELLTGKVPFEADTVPSLYYKIVHEAVRRPSQINARVAAPIEHVLLKSLSKEREARYQSGKEFASALSAAIEQTRGKIVEDLFERAKSQSEQGELDAAEVTLHDVLAIRPEYDSARNLLTEISQRREWQARYSHLTELLAKVRLDAADLHQSNPKLPDPGNVFILLDTRSGSDQASASSAPPDTKSSKRNSRRIFVVAFVLIMAIALVVIAGGISVSSNVYPAQLSNAPSLFALNQHEVDNLKYGGALFGLGIGIGSSVLVALLGIFLTRSKKGGK